MTDLLVDDPDATREVRILQDVGEVLGVDGEDYRLEEGDVVDLPAINAQPLVKHGAAAVVGSPNDPGPNDDDEPEPASSEDLLMAAMGDSNAMDTVGTKDVDDDKSPSSTGSGVAMPQSALPLAQLDALDHDDRRRAAKQRGLKWPTTREARDRLFSTITQVMRNEDTAVVDAPTALGKSHSIAATSWSEAQLESATGGKAVVHLQATRDARDEAIETAREAGVDHFVLRARHEADGTRRRTRIKHRPDGAWDLLKERKEDGEWEPVGHEPVQGVWVEGDLHGSFGQRDREEVAEATGL